MANTNFPPLLAILETVPLIGNECGYAQAQGYYHGTQREWDSEMAFAIKHGFIMYTRCAMCVDHGQAECPDGWPVVTEAGRAEYDRLAHEHRICDCCGEVGEICPPHQINPANGECVYCEFKEAR